MSDLFPLKDELGILSLALAQTITRLKKHDDAIADLAKPGDITYIRLCLSDCLNAIGAVDPEKIKGKK